MKFLDRYILGELAPPFLFGLGVFVVLFASAESILGGGRFLLETGANAPTLFVYLVNRLPQLLVLVLPLATLLACLLGFGRLNQSRELLAFKAGGLSFLRVVTPALVMAAGVSLVGYLINDTLAPSGARRCAGLLMVAGAGHELEKGLVVGPQVLEGGQERIVCAYSLDLGEGRLEGLFVHFFFEGRRVKELYASEATWDGRVWVLKDLRELRFGPDQGPVGEIVARQMWTPLGPIESPPSPEELMARRSRPEELTRSELRETIEEMPRAALARERRRYEVHYHQKLSLPLTCLVFAALAIPLASRPQAVGLSTGLGLSVLVTLLYYMGMTLGLTLAEGGHLGPVLAAWLPNAGFGLLAAYLLAVESRR